MKAQEILNRIFSNQKRSKYLILFLFCGMILMLLPNTNASARKETITTEKIESFSLEKEEERLEEILSSIDGVGKCKVLLSVHTGSESILAQDNGETVIVSNGSAESTVTVQTHYPVIQGAIIVSGGCDDPHVRYDILSSVMSYTGLGTDKISICPIEE